MSNDVKMCSALLQYLAHSNNVQCIAQVICAVYSASDLLTKAKITSTGIYSTYTCTCVGTITNFLIKLLSSEVASNCGNSCCLSGLTRVFLLWKLLET